MLLVGADDASVATSQLRIQLLVWWLKNQVMRFSGMKIYFSTYFHSKTLNKHLKAFLNHLPTPNYQKYKNQLNQKNQNRTRSFFFPYIFIGKTQYHPKN
jgi:hypothetical protein